MPTYVYKCLECAKQFEVQQSFTDDALTVCNCEKAAPVRKVFTPVGVTFKGSGFYKNDSRGVEFKELFHGGRVGEVRCIELVRRRQDAQFRFHHHGELERRLRFCSSQHGKRIRKHVLGADIHLARLNPVALEIVSADLADIGIFGGSGLYQLLDDITEVMVETPYGPPSAPLHIGTVHGERVAFLARHGAHHEFPAHTVNYRANVWAMRHAGVRAVFAPCSAGSLQATIPPGDFVVLDQFVDRTSARRDTFFDGPGAHHTAMAHPYDDELRVRLIDACRACGVSVHERGTVVVINGPRFSTAAESKWFGQMGWSVVNMTQYPEVALCNEAELPVAGVALVTDFDAGLEDDPAVPAVTMEQVFEFFQDNVHRVRDVLFAAVASIGENPLPR